MPDETIVISDIHMSDPGKEYSWFKGNYPQYLTSLLQALAANASVKELVLLGDWFDLWLYPINSIPLSVSQIIEKNALVVEEIKNCVQNIPDVYYLIGNHDMGVAPQDLEYFISGQKQIQIVTPDWYSRKYNSRRYLEHGHTVDMFNAPDNSSDTIGSYPLGFFITRLVASAPNQTTAWGKLTSKLRTPVPGTIHPGVNLEEFMKSNNHSVFVASIIEVLQAEANLRDDTVILFSDPTLNEQRYTIGDVKKHYGTLFRKWFEKDSENFLNSMLVAVRQNGLDWYAKGLLQQGFQRVVMGHTHHFVDRPTGYDNDGCWCMPSKYSYQDSIPGYLVIDENNGTTFKPWTPMGR